MARRKPSAEETRLWYAAMRGVTRLKDWQETDLPELPKALPKSAPAKIPARIKPKPSPSRFAALPQTFDGESERRLKNGQMKVEARLDLHGMIEAVAHEAVMRFLSRALAREMRLVLIITGKGSTGSGGSLKRNLAPWLEAAAPTIRPRLRALRPAEPQHGGGGAFYVLLKAN